MSMPIFGYVGRSTQRHLITFKGGIRGCGFALGLLIFFAISCSLSNGTDSSENELTASVVTITNPHQNYPYYYKAQNHDHSTRSDGVNPPKDVFNAYRNKGYDYIALTDHSLGGYTTNCPSGMICAQGTEVSQGTEISPDNHKLFFGGGSVYAAAMYLDRDEAGVEYLFQDRIRDDIKNNITVLAHPSESWESFYNVLYPKMYIIDKMYDGTEIGRGETGYVNFWDWAIPQKRTKAGIAMWGFASDDCHDINSVHFNRGWILINSQNATPSAADIKSNILAGNFFSVARAPDDPTTPDVNEQDFAQTGGSRGNGPFVIVTVESGNLIHVITDLVGTIDFIGQNGVLLQRDTYTKDTTYFVDGSEGYVRIVVRQVRSKLLGETGAPELYTAYSQPLLVTLEGDPLPRPIPTSWLIPILMPLLF